MTLTPPSTPPSPSSLNPALSLSDVFSDSPPSTPLQNKPSLISDIPRLRSTHATAGYRAGISDSKIRSLQPGFDEGYSLGAVFGLKVGYLLGVLEGLWSAYRDDYEEIKRLKSFSNEAGEELKIEKLFGKEWWDEDGVWRYEVTAEGEEVTFKEVVEWHPVVKRWAQRVEEEMEKAGVKRGTFEGREWEDGRVDGDWGAEKKV
ncbi:Essential protein Yae1, N terminal [Mycoblastus sanguinarius]|nr:Essential protein Yae1, N terminal [Mycoblastus sanguinarius]